MTFDMLPIKRVRIRAVHKLRRAIDLLIHPSNIPAWLKAKYLLKIRAFYLPRIRRSSYSSDIVVTAYTDSVKRFSKFHSHLYGKSGLDLYEEVGIALIESRPYWNGIHVYWNGEMVNKIAKGKRILIRGEPPNQLQKLYDQKYLKQFDCVVSMVKEGADFHWGYPTHRRSVLKDLERRKLLSFMNTKKPKRFFSKEYLAPELVATIKENDLEGERIVAIKEIYRASDGSTPDIYGIGWDGFPNWKGFAEDKIETLSNFVFNLCFDNYNAEGYITEKIIDCFYAGTIPLYLGAPDITDYVPENTFINVRDFASYEHLYQYIYIEFPKTLICSMPILMLGSSSCRANNSMITSHHMPLPRRFAKRSNTCVLWISRRIQKWSLTVG